MGRLQQILLNLITVKDVVVAFVASCRYIGSVAVGDVLPFLSMTVPRSAVDSLFGWLVS